MFISEIFLTLSSLIINKIDNLKVYCYLHTMELVTQEIQNLTLKPSVNNSFIQHFSKLNLNSLKLDENKKMLVGHVFFQTKLIAVNNLNKKYYIALTNYYTEKKKSNIYPLSNKLNLLSEKTLKNPRKYYHKILKDNYSFTKTLLDKVEIYEAFQEDNIVIYLISLPHITKKIKELKFTDVIHLYTNPHTGYNLEELYKQIVSEGINGLNKKFYFFYNNIKIKINEKVLLKAIC
jgi:hypothetical protein